MAVLAGMAAGATATATVATAITATAMEAAMVGENLVGIMGTREAIAATTEAMVGPTAVMVAILEGATLAAQLAAPLLVAALLQALLRLPMGRLPAVLPMVED